MLRESDRRLVEIVPTERQLKHQQTEFYGFIHFTVNTFTDQEWGDGTESPEVFNPQSLDARQWARTARDGEMKGLILTCKHHDGFCLWPSKYTGHTVAASPYRNGKGDVVKELSDACRDEGLAFGIYLSPWDRNCPVYGSGKEYDDYFVNQLEELLTGYGDIFAVWFDGACGEGPDGKRQVYDWERYYEVVRRLQPGACISVCGPDVRWCGNEAGDTRASEWSVVPARTADTEKIADKSQQADETAFRERRIQAQDMDLGSREILKGEEDLIWYPAEVNTSIRPGWFYHPAEDDQVKLLKELIHIYEHSVGGNATFLLNIPPDRNGKVHPRDVRRLHELGEYIRNTYDKNLAEEAEITCKNAMEGHGPENLTEDTYEACLRTSDGVTACDIVLEWKTAVKIRRVVLKENLLCSQRIESYEIQAWRDGTFCTVYRGTTVGYKHIAAVNELETTRLRVRILDTRVSLALAFLGIYE